MCVHYNELTNASFMNVVHCVILDRGGKIDMTFYCSRRISCDSEVFAMDSSGDFDDLHDNTHEIFLSSYR
jgi:hypothetical protein